MDQSHPWSNTFDIIAMLINIYVPSIGINVAKYGAVKNW